VICEMKVIRLLPGGKEMGIIRCMLVKTCDDDGEILFQRRWLRQVIVPSVR
jgi:hypothetical protein